MTSLKRRKRPFTAAMAGLAMFGLSPDSANAFGLGCFDTAVIATQPRAAWLGSIKGSDDLIGHGLARIQFTVEESLAGHANANSVTVFASLHTGFNPQVEHFLLLLKRTENGDYNLISMDYRIVEDAQGEFVRLVTRREDSAEYGGDPLWDDAVNRLTEPVRYDHAQAWWLAPSFEEEQSQLLEENPLGLVKGRTVLALRGVPVRRLVAALAARRCGPDGR